MSRTQSQEEGAYLYRSRAHGCRSGGASFAIRRGGSQRV